MSPPTQSIVLCLARAQLVVSEAGGDFQEELAELKELVARLADGRPRLAVLGQFKRGKSSLLNALLGESLMPTSVLPLTSVGTQLEWAEQASVTIQFANGQELVERVSQVEAVCHLLGRYGTESGNPDNQAQVDSIRVGWPADFLSELVLLDTPGIGSSLTANTASTLDLLPKVDAALIVASVDPPLTAVELAFCEQVWQQTPYRLFVLNKIDCVQPEEVVVLAQFFQQTLRAAGLPQPERFFTVSARTGQGIEDLKDFLVSQVVAEKNSILGSAVLGRALSCLGRVSTRLALIQAAWRLPIEDLQARQSRLQEKVTEMGRAQQTQLDALDGDRKRIHQWLERRAQELRARADQHFAAKLDALLGELEGKELDVQELLGQEAARYFPSQAKELTEQLDQQICRAAGEVLSQLQVSWQSIAQTCAQLFQIAAIELDLPEVLRLVDLPPWITYVSQPRLDDSLAQVWEPVLPRAVRGRRQKMRLQRWLSSLLMRNIENLRWPCFQALDESFRRYASQVQRSSGRLREQTLGAVQLVYQKRLEDEKAGQGRLALIQRCEVRLDEIKLELKQLQSTQSSAGRHVREGERPSNTTRGE